MPSSTYEQMLIETSPSRISDEEQYDALLQTLRGLLVKSRRMSAEQKLFELLQLLIEDYDRRHGMPPDDSTPAEILEFLVEESGKPANQLLAPIFSQRSHINEALNGKRHISATQAHKLGKLFNVKPGSFIR